MCFLGSEVEGESEERGRERGEREKGERDEMEGGRRIRLGVEK
jgi:hypothetical protein